MHNLHKRNRQSDVQNGDKIASTQNEVVVIEKTVSNVHCKETTIPRWNPTENIATYYEDFYKSEGPIELRIDRFTEFASTELVKKKLHKSKWRWSASTYIRGMSWKLCADIREKKDSKERFLGVFLYCNKDSTSTTWNCRAKYTFCVVSQKEFFDDFDIYSEHTFCNPQVYAGRCHFISITTLLDPEKGLIKNDTLILRSDVKAETPHGIQQVQDARMKAYLDALRPVNKTQLFSSSTLLQSNFVLVVQGKEVQIQTYYLSMHSQYFNEQFAKHKTVNKAILKNIDYDEFLELLGVIYPSRFPVTAENIESIAKLAHIFKMPDLVKQCEVSLMVHNYNLGTVKLLLMAHWYNFGRLQAKCIGECLTGDNLKQLRNEPEFAALNCRMKAILLDMFGDVNTLAAASATNRSEASDQGVISRIRASLILNLLASSNSVPSDAVLIVENKRIPIHKAYLSMYSDYFKTMFSGKFLEGNQEEIVLEEVDYADILELLAVIYPTQSPVTEENIDVILKLADRFIMRTVLERCKSALNCSSKMKASLKLWLAQRHNFADLQIEHAQQYKSVEDVKKLTAEPEYASLDVKTRALIFDSITS